MLGQNVFDLMPQELAESRRAHIQEVIRYGKPVFIFATELHDTVVQTLGAAKLRSQLIENIIIAKNKAAFSEIQNMISQSIIQARSIITEMSPPILPELGFCPALEWLSEQIGKQHEISIVFERKKGLVELTHEAQV